MMREFFIENLTPRQARQIERVSHVAKLELSLAIRDLASRDVLDLNLDHETLSICQFIIDYNHRCVLPYQWGLEKIIQSIVQTIPNGAKVLFVIPGCDVPMWENALGTRIGNLTDENRFLTTELYNLSPAEAIKYRDHYLVGNITPEQVCVEWLGKIFSRAVIYCEQSNQYNLPLGGFHTRHITAGRHAAAILYPDVVKAIEQDRHLRSRGNAALPLMGCHNGLLNSKLQNNIAPIE